MGWNVHVLWVIIEIKKRTQLLKRSFIGNQLKFLMTQPSLNDLKQYNAMEINYSHNSMSKAIAN